MRAAFRGERRELESNGNTVSEECKMCIVELMRAEKYTYLGDIITMQT